MKTLLLNGSPRPNGNTASLIRELKAHLEGCLKTAAHDGSADDKIDELAAVLDRLMK